MRKKLRVFIALLVENSTTPANRDKGIASADIIAINTPTAVAAPRPPFSRKWTGQL
jgi:hypothetical protein